MSNEIPSTSKYLDALSPTAHRWSQETLKAPSDTQFGNATDLNDEIVSKNKKNFYAKTYKRLMNENQTEQTSGGLPKDWSQISAADLKHLPSFSKNYRPGPRVSETSIKPSKDERSEMSRSAGEEKKGKSTPQSQNYIISNVLKQPKGAYFAAD